ncbi:MAG: serine/threonine protein kinase [Bacteroidia bacterium]|nr:serine/threonine protein kinase [Bacteroidia bacterium]
MTLPGLHDKYEVIRPLGEGGMGVVYLALHKRLDRKVAIKAIAPYLARDPAIRERFTAEAAVLARLNHPHIVTLYDYIEEENALYLIMEYVEGQPLSEILQTGALSPTLVHKYFSQVLDAFAYAHEQGVVHRDIKPSNIMITADGRVKILDFGVARLLQTDHSLTRTGMRLGTLLYMSPEQIKGEKTIDHRSDIYSLGVVLYEMLTGHPPYSADMSEFTLSLKIVQEPLFDLSRPPEKIPPQLLEVILRATEKIPEYRYKDCKEFREDFDQAFGSEGVPPFSGPRKEQVSLSRYRQSVETHSEGEAKGQRSLLGRQAFWWIAATGGISLLAAIVGWKLWQRHSIRPSSSILTDTLSPPLKDTAVAAVPFQRESLLATPSNQVSTSPLPSPKRSSAKPPVPKPIPPSKNPSPPKDTVTPPPKPVIQTEIQNFKPSSLVQAKAKGTLLIRNVGEGEANTVQVILFFLNKKGEIADTDTLRFTGIKAGEEVNYPFQARIGGIKSVRVELLTPSPP